uniref:Uncharacterized protein n=1 Tax=Rhizophora mucronata TaxID=61149 RepID=A0A2P2R503_RHIMU
MLYQFRVLKAFLCNLLSCDAKQVVGFSLFLLAFAF